MRRFLALAVVLALATTAFGDQFYVKGAWNGWGLDDPMTFVAGVEHVATVTGLTPDDRPEYKCADEGWTKEAPGSNGQFIVPASGEMTFHFYDQDSWSDGWEPSAKYRVGYDDPGNITWAVIGAMTSWSDVVMDDLGGGLWKKEMTLNAGNYNFKFRKEGDWDISIGDDFGDAAGDNWINVINDNELWAFELDLPGGRWRAYYVPEPASLLLLGLGALVLRRR